MLEHYSTFLQLIQGKCLAIFLDYDGMQQSPLNQILGDAAHTKSASSPAPTSMLAGTLAPIVKNPDEAFMSEEVRSSNSRPACLPLVIVCHLTTTYGLAQMRCAVRGTAQFFPTAIISGRGREKVEQFVQLSELYYAGSHGMDITGPEVRFTVT